MAEFHDLEKNIQTAQEILKEIVKEQTDKDLSDNYNYYLSFIEKAVDDAWERFTP